ncbi:MAG: PilN domain-containing protein [Pseudomonadota bacterium]
MNLSYLQISQSRKHVSDFLNWWFDELAGLVPSRVKNRRAKQFARLIFGEHTRFEAPNDTGAYDCILKADTQSLSESEWAEIGAYTQSNGLNITLDPRDILFLQIHLPLKASAHLEEAIDFQLLQESPLKTGCAEYAYRTLDKRKSVKGIDVRIAVVRRELLEDIRRQITARGISNASIEAKEENHSYRFNTDTRSSKLALSHGLQCGLLASLFLIPLFTVLALITIGKYLISDLNEDIEQLKADLQGQLVIAKRQAVISSAGQTLTEIADRPSVTAILDVLAVSIPNDSWLSSISVSGDVVILNGTSPDANAVAAALRSHQAFAAVSLDEIGRRQNTSSVPSFRITARVSGAPK